MNRMLIAHSPRHPIVASTQAVAACIGRGGAKERRRVLKAMKGHALQLLTHRDAYLAVLRLIDVTDDTVAVQQNILAELLDATKKVSANPSLDDPEAADEPPTLPLLTVALHNNGSKVLLRLLAPTNSKYLGQEEKDLVALPSPTSKKDPELRRGELVDFLQEALETMCDDNAATLMCSKAGSLVLFEVADQWRSVLGSVAEAACGPIPAACMPEASDTAAAEEEAGVTQMHEHPVAHLLLKRLLLSEGPGSAEDEAAAEEDEAAAEDKDEEESRSPGQLNRKEIHAGFPFKRTDPSR
jgi:pumilio family protein 6